MTADAGSKKASGGWLIRTLTAGRFAVLFWLLVLAIALPVVVPTGPVVPRVLSGVLFVVMLSGLNAISERRIELLFGVLVAVPAVTLHLIGVLSGRFGAYLIAQFLYLAFFVYLAILTVRWTMQRHEVDVETIYAAVSVYLLMALTWGLAFLTVEISSPGSFHFASEDVLGEVATVRMREGSAAREIGTDREWMELADAASGTMMYYSFVTLTTLGYGDTYPTSDAARILAMLEATLGQLYLVILVARLVGLYTAQESERRKRAPPA